MIGNVPVFPKKENAINELNMTFCIPVLMSIVQRFTVCPILNISKKVKHVFHITDSLGKKVVAWLTLNARISIVSLLILFLWQLYLYYVYFTYTELYNVHCTCLYHIIWINSSVTTLTLPSPSMTLIHRLIFAVHKVVH